MEDATARALAAERELRCFDSALELAVKQALRRVRDQTDDALAKALPAAVRKFVADSTQCAELRRQTLAHVEQQMIARCEKTLENLSTDIVLREALAHAAEARAAEAVERLQWWVYIVGATSLLALACSAHRR
jgi:uncharacterized protein YicC (UPF0701 family)